MRSPRVLLITDPSFPDDTILRVIETVSSAIPSGAFAVQFRDKLHARSVRERFARSVRALTIKLGVPLIVNGDAVLARDIGADGLHTSDLASGDGCGLWRSVAAHGDDDVVAASRGGVDAVLVSPVFDTPGKGPPLGVVALERARAIAGNRIAVIALGGIDAASARACHEAGASGVAVIRALLGAHEPAAVARALMGSSKTEGGFA